MEVLVAPLRRLRDRVRALVLDHVLGSRAAQEGMSELLGWIHRRMTRAEHEAIVADIVTASHHPFPMIEWQVWPTEHTIT